MSDKGYQVPRDSNSPAAQSLTENEWQKHNFRGGRANEPGSPIEQSPDFEGKGEAPARQTKANEAVTKGRHTTSKNVRNWAAKDPVKIEREKSVLDNRKATEKLFDNHRRHTSARVRGKKS